MTQQSLSTRLYRTIFKVSLLTIALAFMAAEWMYEDIEESILNIEFVAEREYFRQLITQPDSQQWQTARLNAIFLGRDQAHTHLPDIVRNLKAPFAAEVNTDTGAYLVSVEDIESPAGTLYLIQDISTLEAREFVGQTMLMGLALLLLLFTLILSKLSARRVTAPLNRLTSEILQTNPGKSMPRLATDYHESEYAAIAEAFNRFLDELEQFVKREKAFVNLASHELRTPLAVISGALDVIEKRQQASQADKKTLQRIRRATSEMQADVEILLKLARGRSDSMPQVDLAEAIQQSLVDLLGENEHWRQRVHLALPDKTNQVTADPALVRILIRNIVVNALKHTEGTIQIALQDDHIEVIDQGCGLPEALQREINNVAGHDLADLATEQRGLGLLIVPLVCERLGWRLHASLTEQGGTRMAVYLELTARTNG